MDTLKQKQYSWVRIYGLLVALFSVFTLMIISGCKKFLDTEGPVTSINETNVYQTDATAGAVLTGIYAGMSSNPNFSGIAGFPLLTGLSSDELTLYSGVTQQMH